MDYSAYANIMSFLGSTVLTRFNLLDYVAMVHA